MRIVALTPEREALYFSCLEPWSEEIAERGAHKERWFAANRDEGLVVKLAIDDDGEVAGMIHTLPVERVWVDGHDLDFVLCTWVHGYAEGVGNRQGRGLGTALLEAVEEDARARGRQGMAAWGLGLPMWMRASWYRRHGYLRADRDGIVVLLFKPFTAEAERPRWSRARPAVRPDPDGMPTVTALSNGWCPASSIGLERARCVCAELPAGSVRFVEAQTDGPDALFVGSRQIALGPPPSRDKLRRRVERAVRGSRWPRWLRPRVR